MKIKIESEQELINVCAEALHIIFNLRKFTKLWDGVYGKELKARKKYYEKKADDFISKLELMEKRKQEKIKIEIKP